MSEIYATRIATSRYAVPGEQSIDLYSVKGADNLAFGELVIAVCVRRAAYLERASVVYNNQLADGADKIEELSDYLEELADGDTTDARWQQIKKRIEEKYANELAAASSTGLPSSISSYKNLMEACDTMRDMLSNLNSSVDRIAVELETLMSRRDTTYKMATSTTTHIMKTATAISNNITPQ